MATPTTSSLYPVDTCSGSGRTQSLRPMEITGPTWSEELSLFKVYSNGSSAQISKYLLGDRGTESPVLTDHLAFTFDPTNITVIPVLLAQVSGNQTNSSRSGTRSMEIQSTRERTVFRVNSAGIVLLGRVTQYQNYSDSPTGNLDIYRTIIIGDYLYTISREK